MSCSRELIKSWMTTLEKYGSVLGMKHDSYFRCALGMIVV